MQQNEEQMNFLQEKRKLVDTLCLHLDVMTSNMGMKEDILIFRALLDKDWERVKTQKIKDNRTDCTINPNCIVIKKD